MENVNYVMLVWDNDLENNEAVKSLAQFIRGNNGIVCPFLNEDLARSQKYFARADFRKKYPKAKIIDVM